MAMQAQEMAYHFFVPLTIYFFPSFDFTAVVEMFATSDPALGSVIAIQIRDLPVRISGTKRSCSFLLPNFRSGGRPNATPVVTAPEGPSEPVRAIYNQV
jgi:hypothetical protein